MAHLVLRLLRLSANGCATDALRLTPVRSLALPIVRGTRRAKKALKNKRTSSVKRFSFVLAFESVTGRTKGTALIFCFVLHQGKMKNKPDGALDKIQHY